MAVKNGDTIKVDYVGSLDDGAIFDRSAVHGAPLEFKVGSGEVIKGFDDAVIGMEVGQTKKRSIPPEQAYGAVNPRMVQALPREQLPPGEPKVGKTLILELPDKQQVPARITAVTATAVTLDLNHPLAGKALHFEITLREIVRNTSLF